MARSPTESFRCQSSHPAIHTAPSRSQRTLRGVENKLALGSPKLNRSSRVGRFGKGVGLLTFRVLRRATALRPYFSVRGHHRDDKASLPALLAELLGCEYTRAQIRRAPQKR